MVSRSAVKKNNDLKDILLQHCQDPNKKTGLLLLTLPTGFGKTHYVLEYIAEHISKSLPQKIWFITNLKKNLPIEALKERVDPTKYKRQVLFLNSYTSHIIEFIKTQDFPEDILVQTPSFRDLQKIVSEFEKPTTNESYKNYLKEELNKKERFFRKELKGFLKDYLKAAKSPEERLKVIRTTPKLRWIEKAYPSIQYHEKSVFFCTIDKFYLSVDTIIGPTIQISDPSNIKEDIVFIDEFDATKTNIKNAIINNAVKYNRDILSLFIKIFYGVDKRELPTKILKNTAQGRTEFLQKKLERLRLEGDRIYNDYRFQSHFFHRSNSNKNRAFLFHDFEYHTIFEKSEKNSKQQYLIREFEKKDNTNYIRIGADQPNTNNQSILFLLNDLKSFISLFSYFISDFSQEYKKNHDEYSPEEISIDNAVRTILDLFDLSEIEIQHFFINQISSQKNSKKLSLKFDISPINKGFRYYDILNRKPHNETSKIQYVDTITTPESWMINLCSNANVIGISATAGFDSPISNFSLSQLKHHLNDKFYELSAVENKILNNEFLEKKKYDKKRAIQLVPISCNNDKRKSLQSLFKSTETINRFLHLFDNLEDFEVQRFVRVGFVYLHFLKHPEIHSFLCLLNKFPQSDPHGKFQIPHLKALFTEIRIESLKENENNAKKTVELELKILKSQNFEKDIEEINSHLKSGQKIFLMSTYQTMGAGQNIQYDAPKDIDLVAINDFTFGGNKKDYDGIYLEKPSYSLSFFKEGTFLSDKDLLNYLFEVAYLTEAGAISRIEKRERIEFIFKRKTNLHLRAPSNKALFERKAVAEHYCRVLIQAIGRLSRTRLKSPNTHILFDDEIRNYLHAFRKTNRILIPEFEALLDFCKKDDVENQADPTAIENLNIHNSLAFSALLRKLVRDIPNWRQDKIVFWENLRDFVLKNPTISSERLQNSGLQKFYIQHPKSQKVNRYFYSSDDDFRKDLEISFDQKVGKEMSFESVLIKELLKVPGLENLFKKNGYATSFLSNDFILSPPLFQNVYLGAIGEVIGEHILNKYSIPCSKLIEGEYELFDAKLSENIYVDFKFWGGTTRVDADDQIDKIKEKMVTANIDHVMIINIISPGNEFQPIINDCGIVEIPGLVDLNKHEIIESSIQFLHQYLLKNV